MLKFKFLLILLLCFGVVPATTAQDTSVNAIQPEAVETEAADGLTLRGDFYLVDAGQPTVVLLHELYTTRHSWNGLVSSLIGAGYNVLAVDLRGYGGTGGEINWSLAVSDVGAWFDWLWSRDLGRNGVSIIGSSMGANLAIVGCTNDRSCRTAVAISPGLRYYGISVEPAFGGGLSGRPVKIIYSSRDRWPSLGVPKMLELATNPVEVLEYPGNVHGMQLFRTQAESMTPAILEWLGRNGR